MKKAYFLLLLLTALQTNAQSSYTSANYASNGDVFYNTRATDFTLDYLSTGTNFSWDFSTLTGVSQEQIQYRNSNTTGFIWPYIFNANNTNLSSTNNETNSITAFGQTLAVTNANNYYKKTTTELTQVATAYKMSYNGTQIPITNQFSDSDIIYKFPIDYGDTDTDNSSFSVNIPNVFYQNKTIQRTNEFDGWGSITTPHGVFSNTLRMKTTLIENDTISILEKGLPRVIKTSRELKWFDVSKKQPVLIVTQNNISGNWITTNVKYLDNQRDFQITALFAYTPLNPALGDTVYFQNLSTNATNYSWNFGDTSSGNLNVSTEQHPTHIYTSNGTFQVELVASNETYTKTFKLPIVFGTLGTNDYQLENDSNVFPNPFTSKINVTDKLKDSDFYLFDISGRIIFQGKDLDQHDFSDLSKGNYILINKNESQVRSYKLIK